MHRGEEEESGKPHPTVATAATELELAAISAAAVAAPTEESLGADCDRALARVATALSSLACGRGSVGGAGARAIEATAAVATFETMLLLGTARFLSVV